MKPPIPLRAIGAATLLFSLSCEGPTSPTPITPNNAPEITSLTVAADKVEAGETVGLAALVTDVESSVNELEFAWSASVAGTFSGAGPKVTWSPSTTAAAPAVAAITLTVIERYTVRIGNGRSESRENRASRTATVNVNNWRKETEALALSFLTDFANSQMTPEYCVRNFSDTCPQGKAAEIADIQADREAWTIIGSSFHVEKVELANAERTRAVIYAPCQFTDVEKTTGKVFTSDPGICLMTAVYQPYRWWLCNSNWCNNTTRACVPGWRSRRTGGRIVEGCS
jgi:hypothetical protein